MHPMAYSPMMQQVLDQSELPVSSGLPVAFAVYQVEEGGKLTYIPPAEEEAEWVKLEYARLFDLLGLLSVFSIDLVGYICRLHCYASERASARMYEIVLNADDLTRIERAFLIQTASTALDVDESRILVTFIGEHPETHHDWSDELFLSPKRFVNRFRHVGRFVPAVSRLDNPETDRV